MLEPHRFIENTCNRRPRPSLFKKDRSARGCSSEYPQSRRWFFSGADSEFKLIRGLFCSRPLDSASIHRGRYPPASVEKATSFWPVRTRPVTESLATTGVVNTPSTNEDRNDEELMSELAAGRREA